ncbi:MAG TPA: hypothetical protein VGH02_03410 [Rhizomicrobium sp.]
MEDFEILRHRVCQVGAELDRILLAKVDEMRLAALRGEAADNFGLLEVAHLIEHAVLTRHTLAEA